MTDVVQHPEHPVVAKLRRKRAADVQLRVADAITAFAGSMPFVYVHVVVFAVWMLFVEGSPWPTLTLVVSLEAIILSVFVLLSQNRQGARDRIRSDIEYDVNLKAELEVAHLHEKLDRFSSEVLARLARMERSSPLSAGSPVSTGSSLTK